MFVKKLSYLTIGYLCSVFNAYAGISKIKFDAFYLGNWWECDASINYVQDPYNFNSVLKVEMTGISDCTHPQSEQLDTIFTNVPELTRPVLMATDIGNFNIIRHYGTIGKSNNSFSLIDYKTPDLLLNASIDGQFLTVNYTSESYKLLSEYDYSVKVNAQADQITNIVELTEKNAKVKVTTAAKSGEKVILTYTHKTTKVPKDLEVQNVTSSLVALTSCSDGSKGYNSNTVINKVNCTDSKGNKVVIINPNNAGETGLPGCAGILDKLPNQCAAMSFADEIYAIRLKFNGLNQGARSSISFDTENAMLSIDQKYRRFQISINASPGYFPAVQTKCDSLDGFGSDTILVANSDSTDSATCKLVPGQMYYINVKPINDYCQSGEILKDNNGNIVIDYPPSKVCRAIIINLIPGGSSFTPIPLPVKS